MTLKEKVRRAVLSSFPSLGRAPTIVELTKILGTYGIGELSQALDDLEQEDAIYRDKETGEIIAAYPYSSAQTPHRVTFADGAKLWAMCAIDALGIHFMVGQDVTIESVSPLSGYPIEIRMAGGKISSATPQGVVVWFTAKGSQEAHDATTCCPGTNFFSSREVLEQWRRGMTGIEGKMLSLPDAIERSKTVFGHLLEKLPERKSPTDR